MSRRTLLSVTPFEERCTPASAIYSAGTLFITAATGDVINVSLNASSVPGFLLVSDGGTVFDSGTTSPVANIIVKAGVATNYTLNLGTDVILANLTVSGATASTNVNLDSTTRLFGNFKFTSGAGNDSVTVPNGVLIGGSVTLSLGNGTNTVDLRGGNIGGNVTILTGTGDDTVNLLNGGPLVIGGSLRTLLGDGDNEVVTIGNKLLTVGDDFLYAGSGGSNSIDFAGSTAQLLVFGSVGLTFGVTEVSDLNEWNTGQITVGGNFAVHGGSGAGLYEVVWIGPTHIGENFTAAFGNTANKLGIGFNSGAPTLIGGLLSYISGNGKDEVTMDNAVVALGASFNLGDGAGQFLKIGTTQVPRSAIGGALSIRTGSGADTVDVLRTQVGGALTVRTQAAADTIHIDDTDVLGAALIDLGAANSLLIETQATDSNAVALSLNTRFSLSFTVLGGVDNDSVTLGNPAGNPINFGGPVKLLGGAGTDTLVASPTNTYLSPIKFEDFEIGTF